MRYNPDDKEDLVKGVAGIHHWVCVDAKEKVGKNSGYPYLNLELKVSIKGQKGTLSVYDTLSIHPKMMWKIEQFCAVTGHDFSEGDLSPQNCIGKEGDAAFVMGKPKDNGKQYLEVDQYVYDTKNDVYEGKPPNDDEVPEKTEGDDDLPF